MMRLTKYQIDAFATRLFEGNPAAVVPLNEWPSDGLLQSIAAEHNLSETAYLVPRGDDFELRWFTPTIEVELCGHATLASALVVFQFLRPGVSQVVFHTRQAGQLSVRKGTERLLMDFPAAQLEPAPSQASALDTALNRPGSEHLRRGDDYLVCYPGPDDILALRPNMTAVASAARMLIATAPGRDGADFVSRVFAPADGVDEDPVTGSAHCLLAPYWAKRLGKQELIARQLSQRGGTLYCHVRGQRVELGGDAVLYSIGEICLP